MTGRTDPNERTTPPSAGDPPASPALIDRRGNLAVVTLNRPGALNAVNQALSSAVGRALEELDADPEVRAVVITGAGRAFCAGADLKEVAAGRSFLDPEHPEWGLGGIVHHPFGKPLIAAINGLALGGGAEIVMACDLAVMDATARIGLPEIHRGLIPGAGGLVRLPRLVAAKKAMAMALLGEPITAAGALDLGLVNDLAPEGEALEVALDLAGRVAEQSVAASVRTKRLVRAVYDPPRGDDPTIWELQDSLVAEILADPEAQARTAAFAAGAR